MVSRVSLHPVAIRPVEAVVSSTTKSLQAPLGSLPANTLAKVAVPAGAGLR
jgi:hypothetical protein